MEDNDSDEVLTLRAFKKSNLGNEVVVVRDGAEALDYLFGTGTHQAHDSSLLPAMVLLDLHLPRIDGHEVLRRIRLDARTQFLPVVVLTGSKEDEDVSRSYSLGANDYVRKPVDFTQFVEAVKTLGLFWVLMNQVPAAPGSVKVAP